MSNHRIALWIARRYLFTRRHQHASFINWVSFGGLSLGVMILTVVVSVMNGFDRELSTRLLGAVPHVVLVPDQVTHIAPSLDHIGAVRTVSRFFQGEAMIARGGAVTPVALFGVEASSLGYFDDHIDEGALVDLFAMPGGLMLGAPLARYMGLAIGDPVVLIVSTPAPNGIRPRVERFTIAATFEIGAEPDFTLVMIDVAEVARRGLQKSGVNGWRVGLDDPLIAETLRTSLRAAVPKGWSVKMWTDEFGELFRAVKIEKAIMFALLALVVAIAAFNIVSGQAMIVNDKRGDIAMLTTMGASRGLLTEIFLLQGVTVAVLGTVAGLIAGVAIAFNAGPIVGALESLAGASIIDGTYFNEVPSQVRIGDLILIGGLSLTLCFLAVLRPALRAVAENPVEALHRM